MIFLIRQARTLSRLKVANSAEQYLRISGMHAWRTLSCADSGAADSSRADAVKMKTVFDIFAFFLTQ